MADKIETQVADHYAQTGLLEKILNGLRAVGVDLDHLTIADLAPVDEFHTAGRAATEKAIALTPLKPGMHVLDAGCGIGGTTRYLAGECRCRATGLDLTPDYVEVAIALTEMTGLSGQCDFQAGSGTAMPFADASFDGAVSFHVAMNVEDRTAFYDNLFRVIRPGGFFCLFDVMKGPTPGMRYPVPWAETEVSSFLHSTDSTRALLEQAGFEVSAEENLRPFAITFFENVFATMAKMDGPPPLGLHLLTGSNTPEKFGNYADALNDHQIEPVIMVARKPS